MTAIVMAAAMVKDVTDAFLASLHPEVKTQLVLVDNSQDGFCDRYWQEDRAMTMLRPVPHQHPRNYLPRENIGMACAFNIGLRMATEANRWLVWMSPAMTFGQEGGRDVLRLTERASREEVIVTEPGLWHCVAFSPEALRKVGMMDENFFPGYTEDTCYRRRLKLEGIPVRHEPIDADLPRDGHAHDELRRLNPGARTINWQAFTRYFIAKWGVTPIDSETWVKGGEFTGYRTPFDGGHPTSYWEEASREDLIERYGLGVTL